MEEKYYLDDAYTTAFRAKVLSCEKLLNGHFAVLLDKTYFFPESGGQLSDKGKILNVDVVNVREDDAGRVVHEVTAQVDGEVSCDVDWEARFDHMQQHTGQHVLTRAFIEIAGMPTVSFHMGDETCTIDLEGKGLGDQTINAAEDLANAIIWGNREVSARTVPLSRLKEDALRRSLPEGVTDARVVEIENFDAVACCGTHVKRTGELGIIKVLKHEKVKGSVRVHFVAGRRALLDYRDKHGVVKSLANRFTTSVDGILDKTEKLSKDAQLLRKELQKSIKRLAAFDKQRLLAEASTHKGRRFIVHLCEAGDESYLNLLASACKNEAGTIVFLGSKDGHVVCAASPEVSIDLATHVVGAAKEAGGGGGGKGDFARVTLPDSVDVREFLEKVSSYVKNAV